MVGGGIIRLFPNPTRSMAESMQRRLTQALEFDILQTAQAAVSRFGVINVPVLAEEVRRRNERENVALEDVEYEILRQAQTLNAAIEFDGTRAGLLPDHA